MRLALLPRTPHAWVRALLVMAAAEAALRDDNASGVAAPASITGIGWSDHGSYWQEGYPALMVTDTAPFRYPYYHMPGDTPDRVDYERLARVAAGMGRVVAD